MKKFKFFTSILKERDWLEAMAEQGYQLTDITLGMIYTFKEIAPQQKVYEIERFALPYSLNARKSELLARKTALDIARQSGWEMVAHDEMMNYYFIKDRSNDESDEFYSDAQERLVRAEKYRRYLTYDEPLWLLKIELLVSLVYLLLCFFADTERLRMIMLIYAGITIVEVGGLIFDMYYGQSIFKELSMGREQWELRKKYTEKRKPSKIAELLALLQEKDKSGLKLVGIDDTYLFETSNEHFDYFADTKAALKRRIKVSGERAHLEKKDFSGLGTDWVELSISEAKEHGLDVVCLAPRGVLIYRRSHSPAPISWENGISGKESLTPLSPMGKRILLLMAVGFVIGLMTGLLSMV